MKKYLKKTALFMVLVMTCTMLFGCVGISDGDTEEKSILDDILDVLVSDDGSGSLWDDTGSGFEDSGSIWGDTDDGNGDLLTSLFDAFFGGNAGDFGWGESSYSGSEDTFIGSTHSNVQTDFADINQIPAGEGSRTILVYMIGSNLESESGCGTMDISEMCDAGLGSNVNLIVEAGGARKWQNSVMSSGKLGRYKIEGDGVATLDLQNKSSMVTPSAITDFIKWGVKNYPADKYDIIFWDHGGGTLAGFGMDELFKGSLSIGDIADAIKASNVHFDFVGFDACLMGTVETAYSLAPYADYLIASEEEEPGYGWYYTGWLKAVSKNPEIGMKDLGKIIVDDFMTSNRRDGTTLSVIDLSKTEALYKSICTLCSAGKKAVTSGSYKNISNARNRAKSFGDGNYDQIDIVDFCQRCGLNGAEEVIAAVDNALVYHNTNIANVNGIAMYFPYNYPSYYKQMSSMLKDFGMTDSSYNGFFNAFLTTKSTGYSRAMDPMSVLTGYESDDTEDNYSEEEWYDSDIADASVEEAIALNEDGMIGVVDDDGYFLADLTPEDMEKIVSVDLNLFVDDGEGYIDMGCDDVVSYNDDGIPYVAFDNEWVNVNDLPVPYFIEDEYYEEDYWYSYGCTYAELTSARTGETKDIEIVLCWDSEHEDGYVKGYRDDNSDDEGPALSERNLRNFVKGDKIQFLCDFYDYDGNYESSYYYGDPITVNSRLEVSMSDIGECDVDVYLHMTDIYDNEFWTETVSLYD